MQGTVIAFCLTASHAEQTQLPQQVQGSPRAVSRLGQRTGTNLGQALLRQWKRRLQRVRVVQRDEAVAARGRDHPPQLSRRAGPCCCCYCVQQGRVECLHADGLLEHMHVSDFVFPPPPAA